MLRVRDKSVSHFLILVWKKKNTFPIYCLFFPLFFFSPEVFFFSLCLRECAYNVATFFVVFLIFIAKRLIFGYIGRLGSL
jgi:hypothetical protein